MNTLAPEAPATVLSAPELFGAGAGAHMPTNDEINAQLFGTAETRAADTTVVESFSPRLEKGPVILTSEGLVREIVDDAVALRAQAEAEGMRKPVFAIVAGQPYGETREHLMDAVADYARTGVMPAAYGDTTSYSFGSLLPRSAEAGITPRLYLPREVAEHPDTHALLDKLGFDPATVLASGHNLGGVMDDLAFPVIERRQQVTRIAEAEAERLALLGSKGGDYTPREAEHIRRIIEDEIPNRQRRIEDLDRMIDARLAAEDEKIAAIVTQESNDDSTDGLIAMMPGYTLAGSQTARTKFTDTWKDVDGLSTAIPREDRRWDEATAQAVWRCAEYFAGRSIPKKIVVQLGLGQLVGRRLNEIAAPGIVVDGRGPITDWVQNPGEKPVGVLMSATRGAEIIDAGKIKAARWGKGIMKFFSKKRLVIVDAGSVTVTDPETGKRETRGNLDMSTLPNDGSVEATGPRNGVGPVTGAIAVHRVIEAARHKFYNRPTTTVSKPAPEGRFRMSVELVGADA